MSYKLELSNDKYKYAGLLIMYKPKEYTVQVNGDHISKVPRVLLVQTKRPYLKCKRLTAEIPGGKYKKNETPAETAIREIKEELNLDFDIKDINFVISRKSSKHLYHFFSYITEDINIYKNLYKISYENYQKEEILSVQDVPIYLEDKSYLKSLISENSLLSSGSLYEVDFIFILYRLGIFSDQNIKLCIDMLSEDANFFAKKEFEILCES